MEKPPSAPVPPSTTFVQADAATFKDLVQRLTGPDWPPQKSPASADAAKLSGVKRLHERRSGGSRLKVAVPAAGSASKPASPAVPSPASGFARLDIWKEEEEATEGGDEELIVINEEEEERAIKERRFYLHPSPRSRTRMAEPDLLPLFPLTSPKAGEP